MITFIRSSRTGKVYMVGKVRMTIYKGNILGDGNVLNSVGGCGYKGADIRQTVHLTSMRFSLYKFYLN